MYFAINVEVFKKNICHNVILLFVLILEAANVTIGVKDIFDQSGKINGFIN